MLLAPAAPTTLSEKRFAAEHSQVLDACDAIPAQPFDRHEFEMSSKAKDPHGLRTLACAEIGRSHGSKSHNASAKLRKHVRPLVGRLERQEM